MSGEVWAIIGVGAALASLIVALAGLVLPGQWAIRRDVAWLLAVLLLAPALSVEGQGATITADSLAVRLERFHLFTECAPVGLFVAVDEDNPVGLTEDRVRTMAESRLRAARLYDAGLLIPARLHLVVSVFRNAYAFTAQIQKERPDPFTLDVLPTGGGAIPHLGTHSAGATGANFIMQGLTEEVDRLISEYLRVNEGYC